MVLLPIGYILQYIFFHLTLVEYEIIVNDFKYD